MTICEGLLNCITCGKSMKVKKFIADEYIVKYEIMEEEYQAEVLRLEMLRIKMEKKRGKKKKKGTLSEEQVTVYQESVGMAETGDI
jgi:hypothetical protein